MLRDVKELRGFAIHATDGMIGEVDDLYFDDEDWAIRYLVVDTGHWLSGRKVLISPLAIGHLDWMAQQLAVSLTKVRVEHSPDIDTRKPVSRQHEAVYFGYYGYLPYWGGAGLWGLGGYPGSRTIERKFEDERKARRAAAAKAGDDCHLRSCKAVIGHHISATDGDIGHGWAPLPPRATWRARIGLSIGGPDIDAFIGARDYTFVRDRSFVDRRVYQRILPPTQNVTIINVTTNVTNYTVVNDRIVDRGIAVATVERAVGRRVPHARTFDVHRADSPRRARAGEVAVFRPEVRVAPGRRPAHGTSLVKGDEPPPRLAERRRQREQERRQQGNEPEVTAKDVQRHRSGRPGDGQAQAPPPRTRPHEPQPRDTDRQAREQEQQRLDREKRQANDPPQRDQPQADSQRGQRDKTPQAQAAKHAEDAPSEAQDTKKNTKGKGKKKPKASPSPPPEEK